MPGFYEDNKVERFSAIEIEKKSGACAIWFVTKLKYQKCDTYLQLQRPRVCADKANLFKHPMKNDHSLKKDFSIQPYETYLMIMMMKKDIFIYIDRNIHSFDFVIIP